MKKILNKIFGREVSKSDFSSFFNEANSGEKKRLFKEVVEKANEDQRSLIDRHSKIFKQKTT